ncbi:MAG: sigma-70 family RNA polymerase sigma factor [Ignavibacteria bacterium]|nr:sigma-70 family RNA polymerase sigma factor [Ignavibacteria bacterium]
MTVKENIANKIRSGDSEAFRKFVDEYKDKAYSLCIKILKSPEDAEDALQESFLKLYKAIIENQFESNSKLSTYFYSIVYNTSVDSYKKKRRTGFNMISIDIESSDYSDGDELTTGIKEKISDYDGVNTDQEKNFNADFAKEMIEEYINNLPHQYSIILNMFYLNELSHEEISKILKIPLGTIKNRLFRAREKLKFLILEKYSEEEIKELV